MKILLDMNIPLKYMKLLANNGISALRWSDVGSPSATDEEIMAYAFDNNYVVLTYDLDFGTILSSTHDMKPSVVQIRASIPKAEKAVELVVTALARYANELETGAILTIDLQKSRIRLLPL